MMGDNKLVVSIVGVGNMGGAIAKALSKSDKYSVKVFNRSIQKAKDVAKGRKIEVVEDIVDLKNSDVLIIATKPQTLFSFYPTLSSLRAKLYISIAAGVPLYRLKENLKTEKCVRFMPNLAAEINRSVTALTYTEDLGVDEKEIAHSIASSFGEAFYLEEDAFSAFIGISGSAIAFIYEFISALTLGGVREGISYKKSEEIVLETIKSAIELEKATQRSAIELESMVCSARGTTIEGVKKLKDLGFESSIIEAVSASSRRSRELEENA